MKGLEPKEREALVSAGQFEISDELAENMAARGLIRKSHHDGVDQHYVVTSNGWLALKLDTAARRGVSV